MSINKAAIIIKNFNKWLVLISLIAISCVTLSAQEKPAKYVNPLIGTDGHGHTYPGATLPFGAVQLSPDTDIEGWDWCSGYHYSDKSIMGFSHTHLNGTGCSDYGDIMLMPTTGEPAFIPGSKEKPEEGYRSKFSHANEVAKAGYYSVLLDKYKIKVELTATKRAGFHKYTFPKSDMANVIIDLKHGIQDKSRDTKFEIINNTTVQGYRKSTGWANDHTVYFVAEFSKPFKLSGIYDDNNKLSNMKSMNGKELKAFFQFSTKENEAVFVKVGISTVSVAGARLNLKTEIPGWDFDKTYADAVTEWNRELSKIEVEGGTESQKTTFYTALYHTMIQPNLLNDVDGKYFGMDRKVHDLKNSEMYTVFSLWDIFRAANPLYAIIDRKRNLDMVKSLLAKYDESGLLPVWELASNETGCMIGYHSIPVIAEAYFKGIRDFDVEKAFNAMKKSAEQDHLGLACYKEMGYVSAEVESESVSKTLEYAYDDWCIAQMAKALGKTDDYNNYSRRAKSYANLFDPANSLMRPKRNGRWVVPFDPYSVSGDYTEANSWQYSFFVPHDIKGLMNLLGGESNLNSKLDELFTTEPKLTGRTQSDITGMIGQYAHGNEPSHHMAYLYNFVGNAWKTQYRVREIMDKLYNEKPDGICGNDDCGQTSAWYVLSAMGFYPVTPGDTKYIIGSPLFDKITINLENGKKFLITAKNNSTANLYIQSAQFNGKEYPYSFFKSDDLLNGGEVVFNMGPEQNKEWGKGIASRPMTETSCNSFVAAPYTISDDAVFADSIRIAFSSIENGVDIYFTTDGSNPSVNSNLYKTPFSLDRTTVLKSICSKKGGGVSFPVTAKFFRISGSKKIKINSKYNPAYTGGGDLCLIDGVKGNDNFKTGAWQGYEQVDFDVVVDLGSVINISKINTSFYQKTGSWIFLPKKVEYFVSEDGVNFTNIYSEENEVTEKNNQDCIKDFLKTVKDVKARYVKVIAGNIGTCPEWHYAAGGKSWIFIDEITVE